VPPPPTPRSGTWGGSRAAVVWRCDGWATRVSAFAREGRACAPLLDLVHLGWTAAASGTGARRLAVRRHRRRLRHGKRMASNFSVLQWRL
jgi:hypothetical protein